MNHEHENQELHGLRGERLDQVPPGCLPRTVDELNADRSNPSSQYNTILSDGLPRAVYNTPNLDTFEAHNTNETIPEDINSEDRLFDPLPSTSSNPVYQVRHIESHIDPLASLRQELQRLRTGIEQVMSGLHESGETPPDPQEALRQSGTLESRMQEINGQLDGLRQTRVELNRAYIPTSPITTLSSPTDQLVHTTPPIGYVPTSLTYSNVPSTGLSSRTTASTGLTGFRANVEAVEGREASARTQRDNAALALQRAEIEVQAANNARRELLRVLSDQEAAERVFGTREEFERQGGDYESPVGGMFTRAYARYRAAEEARRGESTERTLEQEQASNRPQQRSQQVPPRPAASLMAGDSTEPVRPPRPTMLVGPLPPAFSQSPLYTMQNQIRGPSSRSPPPLTSRVNNPPPARRPPPNSSSAQQRTSQGGFMAQAQPQGQTAAQLPQPTQDYEAWRASMYAAGPLYLSRNPNANPSNHPGTPAYLRGPTTTPSLLDSPNPLPAPDAIPDFSTIAPDAARMHDVASHHRRIIRDTRAPRHERIASATASPTDSSSSPISSNRFTNDSHLWQPLRPPPNLGNQIENIASNPSDHAVLLERLRRRRNAVGETDDSRPHLRNPTSPEGMEVTIASLRARRQAGLSAAIDQLLEGDPNAEEQGPRGLDRDDGRPEPKGTEEMMVNMECKICFSQPASVAVLPCGKFAFPVLLCCLPRTCSLWWTRERLTRDVTGHFVMCKWCADQTVPSHKADRTRPAGVVNCPVCRKRVKQKV